MEFKRAKKIVDLANMSRLCVGQINHSFSHLKPSLIKVIFTSNAEILSLIFLSNLFFAFSGASRALYTKSAVIDLL